MLDALLLSIVLTSATPDTLVVPLREVVVTGTRTRESLQRSPASVTVVDRSRFANGRGIGLDDVLDGVPGVLVQSRGGAQDVRITIRGYGARGNGERSNAGSMRGIRVLSEGIPISEPDGRTSLDLVDVGLTDRVEVVRSNVSAQYGNASGGVLDLRTNLDFARPFVRAEASGGSFGLRRDQVAVGFTAGRGRGVVSGSNTRFDGWRAHSGSSSAQAHVRFMAPLGESGQDRLTVIGDFANLLIRFPGPLTQAEYDTDRAAAAPPYVSRDERRFNRTGRMAATLEHAFDDRQSVTVSAFAEPKALQRSERNRYRDFTRFHVGGQAVWSLERDWRPGLVGRTSAGVDEALQDGAILFWNLTPEGTRGTTIRANKREAANSAGAFVQQSLTWQDRWALSTALRLDRLDYVSQDFLAPALDARKRFTRVTPKLSVSRFTSDHTVYASLGGGVEAPAFNEIDPPPPFDTATSFNPFLEAMHSTTLELGARGAFTNPAGAWRYDAAAYRIETTNDIVPWAGGAYFLTAGRSRRTGIESSLEWRPSARLSVRGSATLSRNTYQEYANDLGDFSGNHMPGLPEAVWSVATRTALVAGVALDLSAEGASRMWADDANTVSAPGHTMWNAALDWTRGTAGTVTRVFVAGRNLLDAETVSSVFINPISDSPGGPLRYLEPGLPRQWNAGVSVRW
ncbi:MAG: hypothetical protein RL721_505 [Candidatus Eisenbacteria bacterium]